MLYILIKECIKYMSLIGQIAWSLPNDKCRQHFRFQYLLLTINEEQQLPHPVIFHL